MKANLSGYRLKKLSRYLKDLPCYPQKINCGIIEDFSVFARKKRLKNFFDLLNDRVLVVVGIFLFFHLLFDVFDAVSDCREKAVVAVFAH